MKNYVMYLILVVIGILIILSINILEQRLSMVEGYINSLYKEEKLLNKVNINIRNF